MTTAIHQPLVAIVDYGMGNLFSVRQACRVVGLDAIITSDRNDIQNAAAVILPGVGAFGDAMQTLHRQDMIVALRDVPASGRPLLGICLGIQLLMTESHEFGLHRGLDVVPGEVVPLVPPRSEDRRAKVPHVGWNRIDEAPGRTWVATLLEGVTSGAHMYFVHSFCVIPAQTEVILATTSYEGTSFCSALNAGSVFACQFHPERSAEHGLRVYRSLAERLGVAPIGVLSKASEAAHD